MKTMISAIAICASLAASPAVARDPFNDQKSTVEFLIAKPGGEGVLRSNFGNIDTALDCSGVAMLTFKLYLSGQLADKAAESYGFMMWLSAHAVTQFQSELQIDQETLSGLNAASVERLNADQTGVIRQCNQITVSITKALVEL